MIDLRSLKAIEVEPQASIARARWRDARRAERRDAGARPRDPLGVVTKTGIAGLTLSGGIGWLRRKHGLSVDNLFSLEVVTADGRILTASPSENADLLERMYDPDGLFGPLGGIRP